MKGAVAVYQGPGQPMEFREYPLPEVGPGTRWSAKSFGWDAP